uniref:MARVEL domain-containing protein n=1 Tax=Timema douglasi TaxID=61478 RepID=A0A7R8VNP0_TIMDO|nr:unnamed protein product [Timema douglasi]
MRTPFKHHVAGTVKCTILGAVCVGLSAYYLRSYYYQNQVPVLFFLLMATAFLITTFCLMFSSLISISTASFLPKTIFEVIYHIVAFSLYLAASINLMVDISKYSKNSTYDAFLAASVHYRSDQLGLVLVQRCASNQILPRFEHLICMIPHTNCHVFIKLFC